jgi:protein SCO1/2
MKAPIKAMRVAVAAAIACLASGLVAAAEERHTMTGVVLSIDRPARSMMVSTDAVPGFMAAMAMPVAVRDAAALDNLKPGSRIEFVYVGDRQAWRAENIRIRGFENLDRKQLELQRLKVLSGIANPAAAARAVPVGQPIPDFTLTDQVGQRVALSSLSGKVVALTFGYVRCPNPAYCFRLASNLGQLQKQFKDRVGRDLILLTIILDPEHDQRQALLDYARVWTADPRAWHFLTGPVADVRGVAAYFGVEFWKDEGALIHSLNTAVIDRQGKLAANLEGNAFTASQLSDLVVTVLKRP